MPAQSLVCGFTAGTDRIARAKRACVCQCVRCILRPLQHAACGATDHSALSAAAIGSYSLSILFCRVCSCVVPIQIERETARRCARDRVRHDRGCRPLPHRGLEPGFGLGDEETRSSDSAVTCRAPP
eukprot:2906262-Rhodomonas_salina.2